MPLFMVKRENFEWIRSGRKHIEVRKGKRINGFHVTFLCSKWMLKGKITQIEEGRLLNIVSGSNFKDIVPCAQSLEDAISTIKGLYGTTEGIFTAYCFELTSKKPEIIM